MASSNQSVEKSSPTTSGPDSDIPSVAEELPKDGNTNNLDKENQRKQAILSTYLVRFLYSFF